MLLWFVDGASAGKVRLQLLAAAQHLQETDNAALVGPQPYRAAIAIRARGRHAARRSASRWAGGVPRAASLCEAALQSMRQSLGGRAIRSTRLSACRRTACNMLVQNCIRA